MFVLNATEFTWCFIALPAQWDNAKNPHRGCQEATGVGLIQREGELEHKGNSKAERDLTSKV